MLLLLKGYFLIQLVLISSLGIENTAKPKIRVNQVTASSFYKSATYKPDEFSPRNLIEPSSGHGGWLSAVGQWKGAWVELSFDRPQSIEAIEIKNGFSHRDQVNKRDDYYYHRRAKDLTISLPPNLKYNPIHLQLADSKNPQLFHLQSTPLTTTIRITIDTTYEQGPDTKTKPFDVVGLTAIELFQPQPK